jgi:hypothetical protein
VTLGELQLALIRLWLARWPPSAWYELNTLPHPGHSYRVRFGATRSRRCFEKPRFLLLATRPLILASADWCRAESSSEL